MTWGRLCVLLALSGCGSTVSSSPDAAPSNDTASSRDAASSSDAAATDAGLDCDRDRDGFLRDVPECFVASGLEPDCDDDDARTHPGALIVCRDGHVSGCGRGRELASLTGIAEVGVATQRLTFGDGGGDHALVVAERMALLGPGAGVSGSWRADAVLLSPISETILGVSGSALDFPVPWQAPEGSTIRAAAMGAVGRTPLVAMLDDTTARLFEAGLPPIERVTDHASAGGFLPVLNVLDLDDEATLVTARSVSDSTYVHFGSGAAIHESLVQTPPADVAPWLASVGHTAIWSWPGSSLVQLVDARTNEVTSWTLDAPALGRGSITSMPDSLASARERIVAAVATTHGIETLDRTCGASGCTSTRGTFVLATAPSGPTTVEVSAATGQQSDLLVLSVFDQGAGSLHLYFARTPSTLITSFELAASDVRDIAIASTDRYVGRLLLVSARSSESNVTGLLLCDIE